MASRVVVLASALPFQPTSVQRFAEAVERAAFARGVRIGRLDAQTQSVTTPRGWFTESIDAHAGAAVVALGTAWLWAFKPTLSVLLTDGLPESAWSAEARVLREHFDLQLTQSRPGVAHALAELLSSEKDGSAVP